MGLARNIWVKWIGYWGITVLVNISYYWFIAPLVSNKKRYDPIAFAHNLGITPVWIISILSGIALLLAISFVISSTIRVKNEIIRDPDNFHMKCLIFIYLYSLSLATMVFTGVIKT